MTAWFRNGFIDDRDALMLFLEELAVRAGDRILELRHLTEDVVTKDDGSPVTLADREAEAIIVSTLRERLPDVVVVSEENAASHTQVPTRQFFLVDALDGTREFVRKNGKGAYTVNIALVEEGVSVAGVVYAPALERLFGGFVGGRAWEETGGRRRGIVVREPGEAGLISISSRSHPDGETVRWLEKHGIVKQTVLGSSLKFCLVACGEADVYPRFGPTREWDTAAGDAILRAAGGKVLDMSGNEMRYGKEEYRNGGFVAWGQRAHD